MKKTIFQLGLWSLLLTMVFACEEETEVGDPIASFQTETGEEGFRTINFINVSENATSSSWEFGDGSEPSTEENPVHTYEEAGSYEVTLTVTNDAGASDAQTKTVEVEDPNAALTLLAGAESKTWSLLREGTSMLLANNDTFSEIYWAGSQNDGTRPCLYDDEFTFNRSGEYVYNDGGTFWAEFGLFNNVADCDQGRDESCFEATAANMTNACGDDISAWLSGTHTYTYDPEGKKLTLSDEGAWIGIPKLGTSSAVLTPSAEAEITVDATLVDGGDSGVDSMFVAFDYGDNYWAFTYVSYDDPSLKPEIVTDFVPEECDPLAAVSPSTISHTFASNEASEWNLMQPTESGSQLDLGVEDPTDATATPVGKYTRVEGVSFQELKFKLDPLNSINFENMTTISLDVFMPSSNAYGDGDVDVLTDNVYIGFGNEACPPDWFTDQHEYQEKDVVKDEWVTITFDLSDPSFVGNADNGATVFDRNDLDMIYIAIGGGNHPTGAEFFIRNFIIE